MTPLGSTLGIDNWPARWAAKERALENVDWNIFRRNAVLMEGILTRPQHFDLWHERAKAAGIEPGYFRDSRFGSPEGREIDGVFATATSLRMACHAETIHRNWRAPTPLNVLDIGGGYGGMMLALWRRRYYPARHFAIDAEPCLQIQRRFSRANGMVAVEDLVAGDTIDLATNTNSFGEMDRPDVARYFAIIEEYLVDGGAFYTMNRLERVTDFVRYPYGPGWRHVLVRHPFGDKAWVECLSVRDRGAESEHPAGRRML